MRGKLIYTLFLVFTYSVSLFSQQKDEPKDLFYYYNSELEKLEKEIAVEQAEYSATNNAALLASLNSKKVKKEVLSLYASKAIKRTKLNFNNFAYFSKINEQFLSKQKELEEKYDLKINFVIDNATEESISGLGTKVLKTITKNETSSTNRRIDVTVHSYGTENKFGFSLIVSPTVLSELSSKPAFEEHTYELSASSANELLTTKFIKDMETYLSVLNIRLDEKNISELWDLRNADSSITFITPAGLPYTIKLSKLTSVSFSFNDEDTQTGKSEFYADGSLQGFTFDNVKYKRCRSEAHKEQFLGYFSSEGTQCSTNRVDELSKKFPQRLPVVVVHACVVNDELVFKASKIPLNTVVTWPAGNHSGSGTYKEVLPVQYNNMGSTFVELSAASLTSTYTPESKRFLKELNICDRAYIPYAITVANLITKYPKLVSQCYGLQRLIDDFDLAKHLLSAANNSSSQNRTPLQQYQDKVALLMQRADELKTYASNSQTQDGQTITLTTVTQISEYVNDASNICALSFLSPGERIRLIKVLLTNASWSSQKAIVQLFKSLNLEISDAKTIEFLTALTTASNNCSNGNSVITEVYNKITLNDYTELNKTLCEKFTAKAGVIDHFFPTTDGNVFLSILYYDDSYLTGGAPIGTHRYGIETLANGNVKIKSEYVDKYIQYQVKLENRYTPNWVSDYVTTVNPFTVITFVNRSGLSSLDEVSRKDDIIAAPAIFLKFVQDKKFNADALQTAALIADALTVATGPGAIVKAYRAGRMALAFFEGMQVVGSIANISANTLSENDPLRKWVDDFNIVVAAWGGARILNNPKIYSLAYYQHVQTQLFNRMDKISMQSLINRYTQLQTRLKTHLNNTTASNEIDKVIDYLKGMVKGGTINSLVNTLSPQLRTLHNRLINAGVQMIEEGGAIKYMTNTDVELARIENGVFTVVPTRPNIPAISSYLNPSYITNHISKFQQEGCGFIVVKSWTENGSYNSLPPKKFVGLRSEMDAVISKYKTNGNDWKILRDELNLGPNTDLSMDEIYYIKIEGSDTRFSFDVPNGNEGGAIVGEWTPCGYTKNGITEATLIGSENITHNKSITTLISNFLGKCEKIK